MTTEEIKEKIKVSLEYEADLNRRVAKCQSTITAKLNEIEGLKKKISKCMKHRNTISNYLNK